MWSATVDRWSGLQFSNLLIEADKEGCSRSYISQSTALVDFFYRLRKMFKPPISLAQPGAFTWGPTNLISKNVSAIRNMNS